MPSFGRNLQLSICLPVSINYEKMTSKADLSDGKHKETIVTEEKAKKDWERKWADLSSVEFYENVYRNEAKELGLDPEYYFEWVKKNKEKKVQKCSIEVKPSPPFPIQSSKMVGWRALPEFSLEIAGPFFISKKFTMTPEGREPPEAYDFIVLG